MKPETETPAQRPGHKDNTKQPKPNRIPQRCKCPHCGGPVLAEAFFLDEWLPELHMLAARHASTGITGDLAALCLCEGYGLFLWLSRQGS